MPSERKLQGIAVIAGLRRGGVVLALVATAACFSMIRDPVRRFYVLHAPPEAAFAPTATKASNDALVRVRDMDCESAYDRFQMVVRKSPFELAYRQKDVWAVKPGRMVSDLLARALQSRGLFRAVSRELGERRPDWLVSGELHVLELEQLTDAWAAHVDFSLQVVNVDSQDIVWSGQFVEREPCLSHDYAIAVEAMSAAVSRGIKSALDSLSTEHLDGPRKQ